MCFKKAKQVLVGGVNSPVRAYDAVGGTSVFIKQGQGAWLTCEDNHRYVDYVLSYGPLILGHAAPAVCDALSATLVNGTTFGAPTQLETALAGAILRAYPYADKVRFVSSGTEAAMSAMRLARGVTGRSIVVKFAGCYHGHCDALLVASGSGGATLGVPNSAGVLPDVVANTAVLDYNNSAQVHRFFEAHGDNIACVMVEPVAGNMGVVVPDLSFMTTLKHCCQEAGSLLIFDEVMCGFRAQPTGTHSWLGITPDIVVLGKVIGGGLPCGAYAASAAIMDHVAPLGPVYQAGTLSGNPLAMAAGLATLEALADGQVYEQTAAATTALCTAIQQRATAAGLPVTVVCKGTMFTVFFTAQKPRCFADVQACDHDAFKRFFHAVLANGVFFPPAQYEACFTSVMHQQDTIDATLTAIEHAFSVV